VRANGPVFAPVPLAERCRSPSSLCTHTGCIHCLKGGDGGRDERTVVVRVNANRRIRRCLTIRRLGRSACDGQSQSRPPRPAGVHRHGVGIIRTARSAHQVRPVVEMVMGIACRVMATLARSSTIRSRRSPSLVVVDRVVNVMPVPDWSSIRSRLRTCLSQSRRPLQPQHAAGQVGPPATGALEPHDVSRSYFCVKYAPTSLISSPVRGRL